MYTQWLAEEWVDTRKKFLVKTAGSFALMASFNEYSEEYEVDCLFAKYRGACIIEVQTRLLNRATTTKNFDYRFGLLDLLTTLPLTISIEQDQVRVTNLAEFRNQWVAMRYEVALKYRSDRTLESKLQHIDRLLHSFDQFNVFASQHGPFSLLLLLLREVARPSLIEQSICLTSFLGELDLPVSRKLHADQANKSLEIMGSVDKEAFQSKAFTRWLRQKTDIYNLKVLLDLDYEEKYQYDSKDILQSAEHYIATGVVGCFSHTVARTLIQQN